jgi:PKD repeat protein
MARPNFRLAFAGLLVLFGAAGCTTQKTVIPALTGPSETGTSLTIRVTPDTIFQDGASQALVTITAFDSNGQPLRNLPLRAEITVGGVTTDFGTLSARNVVTDSTGKATLIYTAPPPPPILVGNGTIVAISVTPTGTDFGNAVSRQATIRLIPPGTIGAPPSPLRPEFAPPSAVVGDVSVFSATVTDTSNNDATPQVASYLWDFGDGRTGAGRNVTHVYTRSGSFGVTLTITDFLGRVAQVSHTITVSPGSNPTASFVTSPSAPNVGQTVNFNAAASTAAPGHIITSYSWDFGDGSSGGGQQTSHAYSAAGTYTVILTVTDDAGRKATATQGVTAGAGNPTASFDFSPTAPSAGQPVNFDGRQSTAGAGRTIVSYSWSFGDGTSGSGATTTHTFLTAGTYVVRLTVTDDQGKTGTTAQNVTVK